MFYIRENEVRSMKVAIVTEWFDEHAGGVARHVRELSEVLTENKIHVSIITNNHEKPSTNIKIVEIEGIKGPLFKTNISPLAARKMKTQISNFDLIHAHHAFSRLSLVSLSLASKLDISSVLTTHTVSFFPDYEHFWRAISYAYPRYRVTISKADEILAVSESAKNFISYFTPKEALVIPNGVSVTKFKPQKKEYAREKLGLRENPIILYVGRIVPKKGLDVLIFSMKEVLKKYPHALLVIAGTGKILSFLKALARLVGLEKNVMFLGFVEDSLLPYLYNSANVFVLPSVTAESFGIVMLEAMASGVPVVSTRVGGIAEVLKNGECGCLVEPNSPNELAKGIIKLLGDKNLRDNLAKKGRKMVEMDYSWDKIGKKIIEVYNTVEGK